MTVKAFIKNEEKKRSKDVEAPTSMPMGTSALGTGLPDNPATALINDHEAPADTQSVSNGVVSTIEELDGSTGEPSADTQVCLNQDGAIRSLRLTLS